MDNIYQFDREYMIKAIWYIQSLLNKPNISNKVKRELRSNLNTLKNLYERNYEFYNDIHKETKNIEESVICLQKEFMKLLKHKVNNTTTNDELIDIIYQIRYYKNIFINDEFNINNVQELKSELQNLEKKVITLSCKNAIIRIFSMDINLNFEIIKEILNSKVVELENLKVKINYDKENLNIEIYDKEIFEKKINIKFSGNKEDIEVKKNKMISLFI